METMKRIVPTRHPASGAAARRQRGLTLVESLVALTVSSLLLGVALPGFDKAAERRRLEGSAAQLITDIHLARSEALARNHSLRINFGSAAVADSGSCYVLHTGRNGACRCQADGPPICTNGAQALRSQSFEAAGPLRLRANVASMGFDPATGTSTPAGTVRLTSQQGREVRVVVNIMGRARSCSPGGAVAGYPRC